MDKTVLKNFAIYARNKLIQEIKNKASMIGITEKGIQPPLPESTEDMLVFDIKAVETYKIYDEEVKQYEKLIEELNKREDNSDYNTAYNTLIEEVAYTWFNRLIAIRFMEVNNYLPDKMRVLSSGREGVNEPEFVTYYQDTSLNFTDRELEQLSNWKIDGSATAMEKMFHLLFIKQCNALNENLPELFEKTDDYAELLLTISYNDPDGVLYKLVHDVPEEYFDVESEEGNGQVEIIGWMYQYYNTERKDEVFSRPKSKKIQKEDIPAATQLFTPDWIVRYMVENSLGRLWIEKLIASGDDRSERKIAEEFNWKYYIPEAEQSLEVKEQLIEIRKDRKNVQLEDIKFIDPAMGSFHIGVYAFEIFMQLYESQGYTQREASKLIIENNIYGLDIDKRAYQLSYFACMMKGRQYNRRILNGEIKCNLHAIPESNEINRSHLDYLGNNIEDKKDWDEYKKEIIEILDTFKDAKEYGSILQISDKYDFKVLKEFVANVKPQKQLSFETVGIEKTQQDILEILSVAEILSQKYDVVVTNPPYMASSGMNPKLSKYVRDNYSDSKSDLFAVFMERCREFAKSHRYYSMITQHSWMFLSSFEKLRKKLQSNNIQNMIHLGTRAFEEIGGEVVQTTAFVLNNYYLNNFKGNYVRLVDFSNAEEKEIKTLEALQNPQCGYFYETEQDNFKKIPGMPIAYWVSESIVKCFEYNLIGDIADARLGMATASNELFIRFWYEVNMENMGLNIKDRKSAIDSKLRWFPYNKGGSYRKWYGNNEYIVDWENDGFKIQNFKDASGKVRSHNYNLDYIFKPGITWSALSSSDFSSRLTKEGFLFDNAGSKLFSQDDNLRYLQALLSSKVTNYMLNLINPTLNYQPGTIASMAIKIENKEKISTLVDNIMLISQTDWDSFETSWDFKNHPLLDKDKQNQIKNTIEMAYESWKDFANNNFNQLKANEEELNRIFIEIYGLEDELTPEVSDKDITITKIFDSKDEIYDDIKGNRYILTKEDVIKSFISYAVGCMFGRYSLDVEGLAYAGGEFEEKLRMESEEWKIKSGDNWVKSSIDIARDNIILITDEEYFEDDIVNRFINFVKVCYGEETLEENLKFIANALGGKGTPKEIIRNYFIKDFYKDHIKTYQKRPIYWLYDSGKQNGFKALIYMHRYNEDTTGKLRIDYLHKMQKAYERTIDNLKYDISNNKNPREVAASEKRLAKITKQLKECKDYDEKIGHLALARIPIDLDDGVKVNYDKIQTDEKGKNLKILAKIK
ncbi:BREX-1 system adenine-specific DNA-methyltransferase PglX [Clostridium cochlearium]|uniref:BREX-1 system adenine-specific DNA-methyltransferase PglX n=1 Tax=Clostridium cochlearium TaxID=1494 RepID=UPI001459B2AB|nr:BREX-1 system adenine-specific DNA-methyltransferase PglX [Clostridium cochlearium]NME96559.1 BREX-1 system adenine-specific DNA-methyltransferase PglX [Clostridium cochlearium]